MERKGRYSKSSQYSKEDMDGSNNSRNDEVVCQACGRSGSSKSVKLSANRSKPRLSARRSNSKTRSVSKDIPREHRPFGSKYNKSREYRPPASTKSSRSSSVNSKISSRREEKRSNSRKSNRERNKSQAKSMQRPSQAAIGFEYAQLSKANQGRAASKSVTRSNSTSQGGSRLSSRSVKSSSRGNSRSEKVSRGGSRLSSRSVKSSSRGNSVNRGLSAARKSSRSNLKQSAEPLSSETSVNFGDSKLSKRSKKRSSLKKKTNDSSRKVSFGHKKSKNSSRSVSMSEKSARGRLVKQSKPKSISKKAFIRAPSPVNFKVI